MLHHQRVDVVLAASGAVSLLDRPRPAQPQRRARPSTAGVHQPVEGMTSARSTGFASSLQRRLRWIEHGIATCRRATQGKAPCAMRAAAWSAPDCRRRRHSARAAQPGARRHSRRSASAARSLKPPPRIPSGSREVSRSAETASGCALKSPSRPAAAPRCAGGWPGRAPSAAVGVESPRRPATVDVRPKLVAGRGRSTTLTGTCAAAPPRRTRHCRLRFDRGDGERRPSRSSASPQGRCGGRAACRPAPAPRARSRPRRLTAPSPALDLPRGRLRRRRRPPQPTRSMKISSFASSPRRGLRAWADG